MKIEVSIHPASTSREEVVVGQIESGQFAQDKKIHSVLNDERLLTKRRYVGRPGKASSVQHYTIEVPDGYPLAIAKKRLIGQGTTMIEEDFEVLYTPNS